MNTIAARLANFPHPNRHCADVHNSDVPTDLSLGCRERSSSGRNRSTGGDGGVGWTARTHTRAAVNEA
jgi:hypothetical protein